uniref:LuxR family transcriptional regulator n=1 Tax=Mycolicibacterium stellerae TaxID=2358193 RepID=UPI001F29F780|nr:LuxR family transcriptional regulator [Mycolicibacterium stellerae]
MASAVSGLPTGTVTLLLADVEGSTRLWDTQPGEMTAAIARLDAMLTDLVAAHGGVRPVEQGEGDSFVVAFARASDAVACALALQRAPLAPIRLRIGVNTGEIQLRDEGNYIGPTINRTARLRDLGHGGQTLLSGATESMVIDHLPDDAWLNDLGAHPLRDLPRPERVLQLCHPDIRNDFPALRASETESVARLPVQLTSFVGRDGQIDEVRKLLGANRLVTLTGAGGSGKTRMAIEVAAEFGDDVRYVDLAPITDHDLVPVAVSRALGLPDQPGRSAIDTVVKFIGDRRLLMVLDNCEHLLDSSADLILAVLEACAGLTLLTTSREPIGLTGEISWRVPSLSVDDEAVELFLDRARRVRADFAVTDDEAKTLGEICERLDGMPLAIELAAARVRALSLTEILDSLRDRFRLLTGGSRRAVRRQQSLEASVDWSHALLTEPERTLFRRLSTFMGGFDLDAAQQVCSGGSLPRHQILDQLTLLVDKSLVVAESTSGRTRYRLLETVRQYAMEKLGESGEADDIRDAHRDHYTSMAAQLDTPTPRLEYLVKQVETEIDNMRAAFAWSHEHDEMVRALELACSLQPLWTTRGRVQEGLAWFNLVHNGTIASDNTIPPATRVRAVADQAVLHSWAVVVTSGLEQAEEALVIARELDDPVLVVRALASCVAAAAFNADAARPYLAEATELARRLGEKWRLSQVLGFGALAAILAGNPKAAVAVGEEGQALADEVGDRFMSRFCRYWGLATSAFQRGDVSGAIAMYRAIDAEADAAGDVNHVFLARVAMANALVLLGDTAEARRLAEQAVEMSRGLGPYLEPWAYAPLAQAALAEGDVQAAVDAAQAASQRLGEQPELAVADLTPVAELAFARGDLDEAKQWVDASIPATHGWFLAKALVTRAHILAGQGDLEHAEHDLHQALNTVSELECFQIVPDALEVIGQLTAAADNHQEAARFVGAASAIRRQQGGTVRYKIYQPAHEAAVAKVRDALGENDFAAAWVEGEALSLHQAIAYAQRGRGERKRPSTGWGSLTPTELDVVRLVADGLGNKDIASRLFISHRTVQTHLTHVYSKLGITSRVALAQEAARNG